MPEVHDAHAGHVYGDEGRRVLDAVEVAVEVSVVKEVVPAVVAAEPDDDQIQKIPLVRTVLTLASTRPKP